MPFMAPTPSSCHIAVRLCPVHGTLFPFRCDAVTCLYSDLVHAGGRTPLSKPESWWRRVLFLGIATIPVTYSYMVGLHVLFWVLEESRDVDAPERCTISGCRKKATKDCFSCGVPRLRATHEGVLCPACSQVGVGSKASAVAIAPQAPGFPVNVTCLLPAVTSTLHLALHPLPAPPPNPFRPDDHCNLWWMSACSGYGHMMPRHWSQPRTRTSR